MKAAEVYYQQLATKFPDMTDEQVGPVR
jgi:hypothetical protein